MLVLGRRKNERVFIDVCGIRTVVEVIDCGPGEVRLGFTAPSQVTIHREEVAHRIDAANSVKGPDGMPAGHGESESPA